MEDDSSQNKILSNKTKIKQEQQQLCIICHQTILDDDLVFLLEKDKRKFTVHLKCYIEIQDNLCVECGLPFSAYEKVLFCKEHHEYFHDNRPCLNHHLQKHMQFIAGVFDPSLNRVLLHDDDSD